MPHIVVHLSGQPDADLTRQTVDAVADGSALEAVEEADASRFSSSVRRSWVIASGLGGGSITVSWCMSASFSAPLATW